jgi:hypothetical protein
MSYSIEPPLLLGRLGIILLFEAGCIRSTAEQPTDQAVLLFGEAITSHKVNLAQAFLL